ncbi:MAG: ATP-dependent helicase, partial [Candidatus Thorarchaeota archaeon]
MNIKYFNKEHFRKIYNIFFDLEYIMKIRSMMDVYKILDFNPNDEQKEIVETINGPVLIIAGPGSGKTYTLVLRCINLLLFEKISPEKIMLCTFTEKAAASLRDKLHQALIKLDVEVDINEIFLGTIHSIWANILDEYLDKLDIGKGYNILDDFTQKLFIYENSYKIFGRKYKPFASSKWGTIKILCEYFNRITEELIDVKKVEESKDEYDKRLARVYKRYIDLLKKENKVDYANLQKFVYDLLQKPVIKKELINKFSHIMVDEYQDTNYIQEVLFLELTKKNKNLCIVGDDDQSLYRFRGATVQNIIEFENHFKGVKKVKLEKNYRSQPGIVDFYNNFMSEISWEDEKGKKFRHKKIIMPIKKDNNCESVLKFNSNIYSKTANFIKKLYINKVINDYNQVAILLKSVSYDGPEFISALKKEGIASYAPRVRGFLNLDEIMAIMGALIIIFEFNPNSCWKDELVDYYKNCMKVLKKIVNNKTIKKLKKINEEIKTLEDTKELNSLKKGVVDLFYEILGYSPFCDWIDDEIKARNIAILSDYLTKFQEYYYMPVINYYNREKIIKMFFNSFFYALWDIGIDEYEDPYEIFPSGKVQLLTIHQSKGLEFPIVIVNSLHKLYKISQKSREERLDKYKVRKSVESHEMKRRLDHSRLFYVAFSRAKDLLILCCDKKINDRFKNSWGKIPETKQHLIKPILKLKYEEVKHLPIRKQFGVTSDIHVYDVCPKQYKYYVDFGFTPSRGGQFMFGTLVHTTIEEIHKYHLKNKKKELKEKHIEAIFDRIYRNLTRSGTHPLAEVFRNMALSQIKSYYKLNKNIMNKIIKAEEPIHFPRDNYDMVGVID